MHINKKVKEAFILVETMVIMAICILALSFYVKGMIGNIEKSSVYAINNDLLYMDETELNFVDLVEEEINKNEEIKNKIKDEGAVNELEYIYSHDNFSFKITKGKIFIIKNENKNKLYRKFKIINLTDEIIIIPDYYKAYNLTY